MFRAERHEQFSLMEFYCKRSKRVCFESRRDSVIHSCRRSCDDARMNGCSNRLCQLFSVARRFICRMQFLAENKTRDAALQVGDGNEKRLPRRAYAEFRGNSTEILL